MDRLEGLSEDVAAALGNPPVEQKAVLDLALHPPGLQGAAARVAERLRVRVLTWDPVGWTEEGDAGPAVTVEGTGSAYSISLFVGAWSLDAPLLGTVTAELTALADSIVRVGALNEASLISGQWDDLEEDGLVPPLLGALRLDAGLPPARVDLVTLWRSIDEPTIATIVAGRFGPLDLDLSPRALSTLPKPSPGCSACAGERYSVPFELDLARPSMCGPHRAEALAVMARVTRQAEEHNEDAWLVFCHAAADLLPGLHIPYPLRNRLLDAEAGALPGDGEDQLLPQQAEVLIDYAAWAATPDRHRAAMWDIGWRTMDGIDDGGTFDGFAHQVAYRLARSRQFDLAARVVDAMVPIASDTAANLHGELATQLAEAGRIDDARARMELAVAHRSADLLTEIFAAEVDEAAGEDAAAEARYRATLSAARKAGDAILEHDLLWHLVELLQDDDSRAEEVAQLERERDRVHARSISSERHQGVGLAPGVETFGRKVGRNEPCPCGSGRKFKRCHGAT